MTICIDSINLLGSTASTWRLGTMLHYDMKFLETVTPSFSPCQWNLHIHQVTAQHTYYSPVSYLGNKRCSYSEKPSGDTFSDIFLQDFCKIHPFCVCVPTCVSTCVSAFVHACICACTQICSGTCVYIRKHAFVRMCLCYGGQRLTLQMSLRGLLTERGAHRSVGQTGCSTPGICLSSPPRTAAPSVVHSPGFYVSILDPDLLVRSKCPTYEHHVSPGRILSILSSLHNSTPNLNITRNLDAP